MSYVEHIEFGNMNYDDDSTNVVNSEVLVDDCVADALTRVDRLDEYIPRLTERIECLEIEIKRTSDLLNRLRVLRGTLNQERTMLNNNMILPNGKEED